MASVKDVAQVADELENLVGELRSELQNSGDFEKLTQIADQISERADNAAQTFTSVNETLMSRLGEVIGGSKGTSTRKSNAREKASPA